MIDLHLHTTASDGRCTPLEVVERSSRAGLTVIAVTDHDTTAASDDVRRLAAEYGIEAVSGIEITAIADGRDVHMLGYFLDPRHAGLGRFLAAQREVRLARLEAIGERLAALGMPVDLEPVFARAAADRRRSVGRPLIARAMVEAGYVADTQEAFDRWLGAGCPVFVPRSGASPEGVIEIIHEAGGLASLAHPGKLRVEPRIAPLTEAGLDAIEAFHPDHDALLVEKYILAARELGLLVTGGSDFHGDPAHGLEPGSVTLPAAEFDRLRARVHGRS
ncbi:MAG: PHP domain-containing protein [Acidobacteria bacterium]|nr:PHP domain-containing protein [Acidobacteriota bacterium]